MRPGFGARAEAACAVPSVAAVGVAVWDGAGGADALPQPAGTAASATSAASRAIRLGRHWGTTAP